MADAELIMFEDNGPTDDNQIIVYKHPCEDFCTGTQLIVHESQEAIFFMDGRAMDTFLPGRHTLETQNLPLLGNIFHLGKGKTPFHCSVYFFNKIGHIAMDWGTFGANMVEYKDPVYDFPLCLGAHGEVHFCIEDSRRLLMKLVGTHSKLTKAELSKIILDLLMMHFKSSLASLMIEKKICIFDADKYLEEISSILHGVLKSVLLDFGIDLERFVVAGIQKPEEDANYQYFKGLFIRHGFESAEEQLKQKLRQQVRMMENGGQDTVNVASSVASRGEAVCSGCGAKLSATARFCPQCGKPHDTTAEKPLVLCLNCGSRVHLSLFCENCGTPFFIECPHCHEKIQAESAFCSKPGVQLTSKR